MHIELIEAQPEHADAIGRIFYHAFKDLMDRHGLPLDIPSEDVGIQILTSRIADLDSYGVVALVDGVVAGGNFYTAYDPVAGVGPLIVDPTRQGLGLGRRLMKHVVDHATANHGPQVRLMQDAINMTSLSLYTSLGYTVTEPFVLLQLPGVATTAPEVRPLSTTDIDACEQLSLKYYKVSRRNEVARMIEHGAAIGITPVGIESDGVLTGYVLPGFFGHGVAASNADLIAMVETGQVLSPHPMAARWICPSRNGDLYRLALSHGYRASRGLHGMAIGPYEIPEGAWFSSIEY